MTDRMGKPAIVLEIAGADQDGPMVAHEYTATGMRFAMIGALAAAVAAQMERADAAEALLREAVEVLEPFARAGSLFEPRGDSWDMVVYCPAAGDKYKIVGDDLRAARALADKIAARAALEDTP